MRHHEYKGGFDGGFVPADTVESPSHNLSQLIETCYLYSKFIMSVQDLARCLSAAGDARLPDEAGLYLLNEEDHTLTENLWIGSEVEKQTFIASDVRKNTAAPYLLSPGIVRRFCHFCPIEPSFDD